MVWSVVSQVNVKEPIVHTCQPATVVDVKFRVPLWLSYQESMPDDQKFPGKTHVLSENKFHWRLSVYIFIRTKLHCWIYNDTTLVLLFLQGFSIKYIHAWTNSQLYGWNWFYNVSRFEFHRPFDLTDLILSYLCTPEERRWQSNSGCSYCFNPYYYSTWSWNKRLPVVFHIFLQ